MLNMSFFIKYTCLITNCAYVKVFKFEIKYCPEIKAFELKINVSFSFIFNV